MAEILVVDDDENARTSTKVVLERAGFLVTVAENGHQAGQLLSQRSFDLVITDLVMPGKAGIELITDLAKHFPNTAVIAMSGAGPRRESLDGGTFGQPMLLSTAKMIGADAILGKPFGPETLLLSVRKCLDVRSKTG
ncbi:MAG: response regulator [Kordiimonadaceae bacterium]|nr:response regulator [Kordiimonadaceae bacterium]